ncbi:uncharacterized protein AB675_3862 [Cyphellophora attinorum]|uniref:Transmembrane protein n=1 Tax=Cyphellophora attinorum TaxID=1664694 RepID=A0A0N1NXC5_9EURO|nr:uncharacterized protein AB675_3862 [Phialophora attinorum]KPI34954.1 hypothetical protein AB675_3862 [Phialophora attinorum]
MRDSSTWLRRSVYEPEAPQSTWFFRATAIAASWIVLAGYSFFTVALTAPREDLKWRADVLGALGGIALASGYAGATIAFIFSKSLRFKLDSVVLPVLLSSIGGLFEFVLNYVLHETIPVTGAYIYIPLVTACVFSLLLAGAALYINTRLKIQKAVESSRKSQLELNYNHTIHADESGRPPSIYAEPPASAISASSVPFLSHSQPPAITNSAYHGLGPRSAISPTPPLPHSLSTMPMPPPLRHMTSTEMHNAEMNIPEDEAQRRQLLRLLIAKEQEEQPDPSGAGGRGAANPSPEPSGASSTYRIDWPGATSSDDEDDAMLYTDEDRENNRSRLSNRGRGTREYTGSGGPGLSVPSATELNFPPPPKEADKGKRWSLGNLLSSGGGKKAQPEPVDMPSTMPTRAKTVADIKMERHQERERRRMEIERSTLQEGGLGA